MKVLLTAAFFIVGNTAILECSKNADCPTDESCGTPTGGIETWICKNSIIMNCTKGDKYKCKSDVKQAAEPPAAVSEAKKDKNGLAESCNSTAKS